TGPAPWRPPAGRKGVPLATPNRSSRLLLLSRLLLPVLLASAGAFALAWLRLSGPDPGPAPGLRARHYRPRAPPHTSGFFLIVPKLTPRAPGAPLEEISATWKNVGRRLAGQIDQDLAQPGLPADRRIELLVLKAQCYNYEGRPRDAYRVLAEGRALVEADDAVAETMLFTWVFFQGVTALRIGEDDNCVLCRGESACIFPLSPAAVHTNPSGSRLAVRHFTEYLRQFPDDLGVRWLLNLAHMTLGEHPGRVDPRYLLRFARFCRSEFDIGRFRDVGHLAGVSRLNQAGGAILEDFDNDGLLDLVTTSVDATMPMAFYRNKGDGTFE